MGEHMFFNLGRCLGHVGLSSFLLLPGHPWILWSTAFLRVLAVLVVLARSCLWIRGIQAKCNCCPLTDVFR